VWSGDHLVPPEVDADVVGPPAAEVEDEVAGLGLEREIRVTVLVLRVALRASEIPTCANTYLVRPEQSKPRGEAPP
jgi:hypothetical protein